MSCLRWETDNKVLVSKIKTKIFDGKRARLFRDVYFIGLGDRFNIFADR